MSEIMREVIKTVADRDEEGVIHSIKDHNDFVEVVPGKKDCLDYVTSLFGCEYATKQTQFGTVWVRPAWGQTQ